MVKICTKVKYFLSYKKYNSHFSIDQQVQTDLNLIPEKHKDQTKNPSSSKETDEIINILRKGDKNEEYESQAESEAEQGYEYVMHCDNDIEFVVNEEFIVPSNSVDHEEVQQNQQVVTEGEDEMDEDVQDSDRSYR